MRWRAAFPFIMGVALVLATAPAARTAPGDLDPTFGNDGVVRTELTPAEDDGYTVTIQPDGKIVVAGEMGTFGPNPRMAIVRYETDGSLDPSFGDGDGKVSIDFTPFDDFPYAVRIQADGRSSSPARPGTAARTRGSRWLGSRRAVRSIRRSAATGP